MSGVWLYSHIQPPREALNGNDTDFLMEHKEVFEVGRCCTWSRAAIHW